ncbi:D-alanyl-D-alanine carboxypeptidase [Harryflintia acetispora]|nr:D-alanyl-D-alanine carboxypeptidase [Harryflintia acetispora]
MMFCLLCAPAAAAGEGEEALTSAKAAVVMEMKTGRLLYDQNGEERLPQASTTKIMTTLLALEEPDIDTYFTVDSGAVHVEGSSMGLLEGDQVSLRALCYGMILPSGNDAANVTAVRLAGSIPNFAKLMNERAKQLGLADTAFVTPSGLDADGHYTTARDLAELTRYAMGDETFREICCQYRAQTKFGNPPFERWLKNHNKLLEMYENCIGVKTGFTDNAGRVLVSAAQKDGVELVCVTMDDPDDWRDHENLYEMCFAELSGRDVSALFPKIEMPVAGGEGLALAAVVGDTTLPLRDGEYERLEVKISVPPFEYAPVRAGQQAGRAELCLGEETLLSLPLVYEDEVAALHPYRERRGVIGWFQDLFRK